MLSDTVTQLALSCGRDASLLLFLKLTFVSVLEAVLFMRAAALSGSFKDCEGRARVCLDAVDMLSF